MEYHIIGLQRKEYHNGDYPTKYYLHTLEYPYVIQVDSELFKNVLEKSIDSFNFPLLTVSEYEGKFYYKYKRKEN